MSGCTATARLLGSVHGVVVQTSSDSPDSRVNPTVTAGTQIKFTATGHFSDGSTQDLTIQCSWSSTNRFVAKTTMARKRRGLVTTIQAGTATIRATTLGVTGTTTVTVL